MSSPHRVTTQISGMSLIKNLITPEEETTILRSLAEENWDTTLSRRTQHYGCRYEYARRAVDSAKTLDPLPPWTAGVIARLSEQGIFEETPPQQLIDNEYLPGQGIGRHVDAPVFGEPVVSVSLESPCTMIFRDPATKEAVELDLPRRSALVLRGDARYRWTHEIPARKFDRLGAVKRPRGRRCSLTFRVLK